MERKRIQVYADTETKRCIELVAAKHDLRAPQEKIKTRRNGKLIDLDRILERIREERDYELDNLR